MSLRRQLTLVSLLLLALPWAGCQFLRETESTLRHGQAQALQATAQAIAASLGDQPQLIYPDPQRLHSAAAVNTSIYARAVNAPIILDGYADDWLEGWSGRFASQSTGNTSHQPVDFRYRAATREGQLYLLLAVQDSQVI
ncbi:MAG: histidine kinase, partial [Parahaliea sp.]